MKPSDINIKEFRHPQYRVDPLFVNRWSPRAMSGESITDPELFSLFEAARWAPSAYNTQPWQFIYAKRDTPHWDKLFTLMGEFNQSWNKNAAAIVLVTSRKTFERNNNPDPAHALTTGAAFQNIALQASLNGLIFHGMTGFDFEKARKDLNIPDEFEILAMFSVGKEGKIENLPESIQKQDKNPSDRKKVEEFAFEGEFRR